MASVILNEICKMYQGDVVAVDNVSLEIKDREFVVLVGPSGCGKSTTLRMIAGLEEISSGSVSIDGKIVNDVPPKNRDIAMVFQNYALYPHMSVFQNLAFGLKLRGYPKVEIDRRVRDACDVLELQDLLDRKPKQLSGGQRQRVAVGRAIVRKPKVFLFDEPLSNLDAKLRVAMRTEIKKLHLKLQATMVYVTHDQIEALTMGDRIVVMNHGLIQQVADPITLYQHPVNKFVAGFIGSPQMNFMTGKIMKAAKDYFFVNSHIRVKLIDDMYEKAAPYQNKEVCMGIRPENIYDRLFAQAASDDYTATATVEVIEPMGSEIYLHLSIGDSQFIARVGANDTAKVNQDVQIVFDMTRALFFDMETERTIIS